MLDGRRAGFEITAHDPVEKVALGKHYRFIVDVEKSIARLKKKAAKE
jgi:fluoroacetyl-CoA thioesterase